MNKKTLGDSIPLHERKAILREIGHKHKQIPYKPLEAPHGIKRV